MACIGALQVEPPVSLVKIISHLKVVLRAAVRTGGANGAAKYPGRVGLDEGRAVEIVAARILITICRPVYEETGLGRPVLARENLQPALGRLHPGAPGVPVLKKRKHLGSNRRIPHIQETVAAQVIRHLISMSVL